MKKADSKTTEPAMQETYDFSAGVRGKYAARYVEGTPLSEEMIAELDREMEEYRRDPPKGSTWEQVRERIRSRARPSA
jgi:hypothetical protein